MGKEIDVKIKKFHNLLINYKKLIIPPYQRPYTWGSENLDKMIEDFNEFLKRDNSNQYYMGSILLHKDKDIDGFNIIDGQQRITTLLLLAFALDKLDYQIDMEYDNILTKKRIKENYEYLKQNYKSTLNLKSIFEKICFTVIVTDNEDDAFTFFDTQNSRGVQPSVLVLLKAFNLRCINSDDTQIECATKWDSSERDESYHLAEKSEKLEWLIKIFFYRVRNWRSNKKAHFGNYDKFRDYFTKEMRESNKQEYKLFTSIKNQKVIDEKYETIKRVKNLDWFDFALRQPIYQGEGFFRFLNHYSALLDELMKIEIKNSKNFADLLKVQRKGSIYMESFLTMITLTYYDRFGDENIINFVKIINDILVEIRLKSTRILKQTLEIQFIRCKDNYVKQNILDFICSAFDSQEVTEWLKRPQKSDSEKLDGVRLRFYNANNIFWGIE